MAPPTLSKTWQFAVNQVVIGGDNSATERDARWAS